MECTPLKKREKQREERRQQILECGLDMIVNRGFEATKIRDIAEKLRISVGLFFNYFESKEKLYEELVKIGLSGPASVLGLKTSDMEPITLFERMTETIFESLHASSFTAKMFLLMSQVVRSQTAPANVKEMVDGFNVITPLVPVIAEGQQLGQIKKGDPTALIIAYWGAVMGVSEFAAYRPDMKLPQSRWIVDILRK